MRKTSILVATLFLAGTLLSAPRKAGTSGDEDKTPTPTPIHKKARTEETPKSKSSKPKPKSGTASKKARKSKAKPKPATRKKRPAPTQAQETPAPAPRTPTPEPYPDQTPWPKEWTSRGAESPSSRPTPTPEAAKSDTGAAIVVQKSGVEESEPAPTPEEESGFFSRLFGLGKSRYKYLTPAVRAAIDNARVVRPRWRYIVVHNSGTRQGNAKAFDYYHKYVRKMQNGLAYHFVIGNGTSSGNGAVEVGPRWRSQINGGHVHSDYLNSISLGICLVGDFNHSKPTKQQLEASEELIRYLRNRVGKIDHQPAIVKPHRDINPPRWPTDCPGDRFPYDWFQDKFD